ncbi:uncharacterized protein LOC114258977 [Camellia sinensis]|uniref:uncharacterized protein LOC114258977 n=1 Tax=Camellia sinensis TaxID=4442 RepID=UPI00103664E7|nr:uncharacterized protein LOC114258977 [Camellia sinensis]
MEGLLTRFCDSEAETSEHVLLFCPVVWKVWSNLLKWWGIQWVIPRCNGSVEGLLNWWDGFKFKKFFWLMWKSIPLALMWTIWKSRNECVFKGVQPQLKELCKVSLWAKYHSPKCVYSVHDLVSNLQQIRDKLIEKE